MTHSLFRRFQTSVLVAALFSLGATAALAQFGQRPPSGPSLHGAKMKLFGDHPAFSAVMRMTSRDGADEVIVPGKIAFQQGMSRFEMDITEVKGGRMKDKDAKEAKSMGMDKMISIARPDKKLTYSVWPGFKSYLELPMTEAETAGADDAKVEVTPLGQDTVDGHPCEKSKVVVTDKKGAKHESTVWNATDLKKFPVQIETVQEGQVTRMLFKDVQFGNPPAELFEIPEGFKRYNNMQEMMMTEMMKRQGEAEKEPVDAADGAPQKEKGGKKVRDLFRKKVLPF